MGKRTALLIRCTVKDAASIRKRAAAEHRTVAGYLLHVLDRMMDFDEKLARDTPQDLRLSSFAVNLVEHPVRHSAVLLRCSAAEAGRIRSAAKRRGTTISGLVIHYLRVSWNAASGNDLLLDHNLSK